MVRKLLPVLVLLAGTLCLLFGEVQFSGLDLSSKNELLFTGTTKMPGYGEYSTLFLAKLGEEPQITQLSIFPERIMYLEGEKKLQIQNRFGIWRTDTSLANPAPVAAFPSFLRGGEVLGGKLPPVRTSPDGRYLAYLVPTSYAYGDLYITDLLYGRNVLVSRRIELSTDEPPVVWSPDSSVFVYDKDGTLYYYDLVHLQQERVLDESLRVLGTGSVEGSAWGGDGALYCLSGEFVFRILRPEFFTGSFYTGYMRSGSIVGTIPFSFDPNFDLFRISPDGRTALLCKGGRNLFLYALSTDEPNPGGGAVSAAVNLPYLMLPANAEVKDVAWSVGNVVTVLVMFRENGADRSVLYRWSRYGGSTAFSETPDRGVNSIALSADGASIALVTGAGVQVKDYRTWETKKIIQLRSPLSALWTPDGRLVVAGAYVTELLDPVTGTGRLIAVSQPEAYGFSSGSSETVCVRTLDRAYEYAPGTGSFIRLQSFGTKPRSTASAAYRVYTESSPSGGSSVMVRDLGKLGTVPLLSAPAPKYEPFPSTDETVDFMNFSHGSRIRQREVAIVFNAIDSADGLFEVLSTLSEYGVRATFFVNGEFIRRFPSAVREIAASGHEVGSLFSSYFTMTDSRYAVDDEFVRKGLAKNEDDYFAVTGKELSLLWHAPYYGVSSSIIRAARALNYTYVGRDVDTLDWVSSRDEGVIGELYYGAAELVERILEKKKPGSILPVTIGKTAKGRDNYLFQKLDLLIDNLIRAGYSIVPVSTLIEHAK
jgi:peptidoglycan/xylan/chitin deacetylase (PgdA/CDA1 family)